MKKYISPKPGPTPKPGKDDPATIYRTQPIKGKPKMEKPKRKGTKEVYSPNDSRMYVIDKKSGNSIASSVKVPRFRPRLTKGGR